MKLTSSRCNAVGVESSSAKLVRSPSAYIVSRAVHRPTCESRIPCNKASTKVVLVDAKEGFRMMGHGERDLKIGDKVTTRFETFTGHIVPYFVKS